MTSSWYLRYSWKRTPCLESRVPVWYVYGVMVFMVGWAGFSRVESRKCEVGADLPLKLLGFQPLGGLQHEEIQHVLMG
jgi:hypothetical protein